MAKKNFYAVRVGRVPDIYSSWPEAEQQVKGFPGAKFAGFATREEAEAFMQGGIENTTTVSNTSETEVKPLLSLENTDYDAIIYVDGSFIEDPNYTFPNGKHGGPYSYGLMIIDREGNHYFSQGFEPDEYSSSRNVLGEVKGATAALNYCINKNFTKVVIYYDYKGIELWCRPIANERRWDATKAPTQAYAALYNSICDKITIDFIHTPGHSGIHGNEVVDSLAKAALGIKDSKATKFADILEQAVPYEPDVEEIER